MAPESSLGGYAPPPEFVVREARAAGPIPRGHYRVITAGDGFAHHDFNSLKEARKHADDVASEADFDGVPPGAYIVSSEFECVDIGIQHNIRRRGKSAWESYQAWRGKVR